MSNTHCQSPTCEWLKNLESGGQPRRLAPGDPFGGLCSGCYTTAYFQNNPHLRSSLIPTCHKCQSVIGARSVSVWVSRDEKAALCPACVRKMLS